MCRIRPQVGCVGWVGAVFGWVFWGANKGCHNHICVYLCFFFAF